MLLATDAKEDISSLLKRFMQQLKISIQVEFKKAVLWKIE